MLEEYFVPFMVNYLKDIKSENISIVATPEMQQMLESFEIKVNPGGFYELAKMNKEQYLQFRKEFIEDRQNKEEWKKNRHELAMENLLRAFCLIMFKKLPAEVHFPGNLHTKIHLVPPKTSEKEVGAIVRLTIPQKKNPKLKDVQDEAGSDKESQKTVPEFIEIDQEGKALAVNGLTASLPSRIVVINQGAARQAREEFIDHIQKVCPEYFQSESGQKAKKEVLVMAEKLSQDREEQYIVKHSNEYEQPHFDIPVDAHSYDH